METNKMNWMVDAYQNENIEYLIHKASIEHKITKGNVIAPTGAGKSGLMFADAIFHIDHLAENEKLVIVFAAPILRLVGQSINDFIDVLKYTHKDMTESGKFMFFVNSSANGKDYKTYGLNADVNRLADLHKFEKSDTAKVAIVASCYDSLPKFAKKIDYVNSFATTAIYLDEAHLVINETRDDLDRDALKNEGKEKWDSLEALCTAKYIYAVTATPDKYVKEIINKAAGLDVDDAIINISPSELISKNIILPVKTYIEEFDNDRVIDALVCEKFMAKVKAENPNIKHKILVTCRNTPHLKELRDNLMADGYVVFGTNAKEGTTQTKDGEIVDVDAMEFINKVDKFDGDCFVLHIRQLRQGIDINTLTDTIYYNATRVNDGVKRILIQTIGRILRPKRGERGVSKENRLKKHGNVLFLIGKDDFVVVLRETINFLLKYYGREGITAFTNDTNKDYGKIGKSNGKLNLGENQDEYSKDIFEDFIEELKVNMRIYVEEHIVPNHKWLVSMGGKDMLDEHIKEMQDRFYHFDGEYCTEELFTDTEFMKYITDLFVKYNVND